MSTCQLLLEFDLEREVALSKTYIAFYALGRIHVEIHLSSIHAKKKA